MSMISPTTVTILPAIGFSPVMAEATVSVLQRVSAVTFFPTSAAGSLYEPLVGFDQLGNKIPVPLAAAARPAAKSSRTPVVVVLRRILPCGSRAISSSFEFGSICNWQAQDKMLV